MLSSPLKALSVLLVCGSAFALASGCGSDDGKKTVLGNDAGAAGAGEGGGPSSGGSMSSPGGAAGEPSAGQAGAVTANEGGVGGVSSGGAASAGEAGQAGAAPIVNDCETTGAATGLAVWTEPTYSGCRGSLVHIGFDVVNSDNTFSCCGVSTSKPAFVKSLQGISNQDGGGDLLLAVQSDAPLGSYSLDITCPGQAAPEGISLEISDTAPPVVSDVTAEIFPNDTLVITGENLDTVTSVMATNPSTGNTAFCNIDAQSTTATSLSCSFNAIPATNAGEAYILDVSNNACGSAQHRPTFIVNPYT